MIIVQLTGGMGNQMFQYAFGRFLAAKHKTTLKIDLTFFKTYTWHEYSLGPLDIDEQIASDDEVRWLKGDYAQRYKRALIRLRNKLTHSTRVIEQTLVFDSAFMDLPDQIYLEGYWQSQEYFMPVADTIRKQFKVKFAPTLGNKIVMEQITDEPSSVSIHIRRGNYVNVPEVNKVHGVCSIEYYQQAIKLIENKISDPHYFIFSDDIAWAKQNLVIDAPHVFVDKNDDKTDYEDIRLMATCRHHVIANSTFSWWAAWLNASPEKIVVAPIQWFNDPSKENRSLIPEEWLRL